MAGIRNLNITFQIDGGRSARNKLSSMGGIMSSSEELMQAAMPMIETLVGNTKTRKEKALEEYMSTMDQYGNYPIDDSKPDSAIGRPSGFLPGTTIRDPRSEFRKRMDRQDYFPDSVAKAIFEQERAQTGIPRDAEGRFLNPDGTIMSEREYFATAGVSDLEDKYDENMRNIRDYGDDAMRGKSFGYPVGMAIGGLVPLVAAGSRAVKPFLNTIKMGRNARPGMKNVTPPGGGPKPPPPGGASTPPPKGGSTALVPKKVDITEKAPAFMEKLKRFGVTGAAIAPLIAGIQAAILGNPSVENIEEETNTSIEDLNKQTDAVPADVAKNMTRQELADEFMRVAKNTALADPGSYADRFGKSILLGLTTKMAAMGDGATGEKSRAEYLYNAIYTSTYNDAIDNDGKSPAEAARIAREAATRAAPNAPAALTGGGGGNVTTMYDKTGKPFFSTDGTNYVDANGNPYVPPT
jgi:hypothetical protein